MILRLLSNNSLVIKVIIENYPNVIEIHTKVIFNKVFMGERILVKESYIVLLSESRVEELNKM